MTKIPSSTLSGIFSFSQLRTDSVFTRSLSPAPNAAGGSPPGSVNVGLLLGVIFGVFALILAAVFIWYRFWEVKSGGSGKEFEMASDFATRTSPFEYENPATLEFGDYEDVFTVNAIDEMTGISLFPGISGRPQLR
jgi:hypothetical protein